MRNYEEYVIGNRVVLTRELDGDYTSQRGVETKMEGRLKSLEAENFGRGLKLVVRKFFFYSLNGKPMKHVVVWEKRKGKWEITGEKKEEL